MTRRRFITASCGVIAILAGTAFPAESYLHYHVGPGGGVVTARWTRSPVQYFVNSRSVPGVTAAQLQSALAKAFSVWQELPTASISFDFAGFVNAPPFDDDGLSTIGFLDRPQMQNVLGATGFTVDVITGEIVEADIFFNAAFSWSVSDAGDPSRYDLQSIALHEVGHLLGLGHSALGETELTSGGRRVLGAEAVMFPIAFGRGSLAGRSLKADDIAGVSGLYPDGGFSDGTGSIDGMVTQNGRGLLGAHVIAFNLRTGQLVGAFTLNRSGEFLISGLEPGPHLIRVEPLDDGAVDSFFGEGRTVDLDFRVTFAPQATIVPRGGTTGGISVAVVPK